MRLLFPHLGGSLRLCALAIAAFLTAREAAAAERVVVQLRSGQRLAAEIDSRTDARQLWLRYAWGNAEILRPIDWDHVAGGVIKNEDLEAAAFRARAMTHRSLHQPQPKPSVPAGPRESPSLLRFPAPPFDLPLWPAGFCRVESIWADARLVNWDADAAPDGLILRVVPRAAYGEPLITSGTLEAELWDDAGPRASRIGRWTCAVTALHDALPADDRSGLLFRLPLDEPAGGHPIPRARYGTLHVNFAVPAHGVFEARVCRVPLLP